MSLTRTETDPDWWRGAVIYQVYPRSYQDSNGDGIGDLAGIIERLPHIASLGVDAVWLSPFFRSPMLDFGYDVSDYRDVDPMFGTLADFDALIARAHELGLKVLIDLVLSHTSEQHPWFAESRRSRDNPRANWYVWADPKPDGTPPNNWLSIFGGSAWEWDGERMQYYLHNFLIEQPDLNFHEPAVQEALLDVARFWLERGVDGFRLDTVNFYVHDRQLRDNPALAPGEINENTAPAVNPYNFQNHLYDKTRPENLAFLARLRAVMDEYGAITSVGEVGESQRGPQVQAEYTSGGDKLHMCYDFAFLSNTFPTGSFVSQVLETFSRIGADGWACWAFSNHDVVRHISRWGLGAEQARVLTGLLMALRGSVCLYQGEELGLEEAEIAFEELQDPYGKRFWPRFRGRDGCRTPMPWRQDNRSGGFSEGRPWLPVPPGHLERAVSRQEEDAGSLLNFYRRMIAFRSAQPALVGGSFETVAAEEDFLSFLREGDGQRLFCAFNLGGAPREIILPKGEWTMLAGAPFNAEVEQGRASLPAYQAVFATAGRV
ncbi:MAG: alpha-amylase family glycosyl hydrolase [Tropicimonas sp.]|uniref:alpha-amylase family glycosyl hydrolase n=1 Tax=Tropicimonas sp. TaxID=2067044 RepID=UPI003A8729BC